MYGIYISYINRIGEIVIDGERGRNTYPAEIGIEQAEKLYREGK